MTLTNYEGKKVCLDKIPDLARRIRDREYITNPVAFQAAIGNLHFELVAEFEPITFEESCGPIAIRAVILKIEYIWMLFAANNRGEYKVEYVSEWYSRVLHKLEGF